MAAIERTIVQQIADAWGNNDDGVTVLVTDSWTDKETTRDLTPDEARALAQALVLAADAVTPPPAHAAEEPQAPRGDTITPSAHRRAKGVAKTPQIAAEAPQQVAGCTKVVFNGQRCQGRAGHEGACGTWLA